MHRKSPSSAATDLPGWGKLRAAVQERDGYRCRGCGAMGRLSVHHVLPVAEGGRNEIGNLILLCRDCHRSATFPGI
jgi:5-methylcytosine-specific restriction enzyme A